MSKWTPQCGGTQCSVEVAELTGGAKCVGASPRVMGPRPPSLDQHHPWHPLLSYLVCSL
jgi:hypothetical protein